MTSPEIPREVAREVSPRLTSFSTVILMTAIALTGLFGLTVVSGSLPTQLLRPEWQKRFVSLVIDNSGFPVVAFMLVHLAAYVDPDRRQLTDLRNSVRSWAVLVTILYLLIIPFQSYLTVSEFNDRSSQKQAQIKTVQRQFASFRSVVMAADNSVELEEGLRAVQGPTLGTGDLAKPFPQLREELLEALQTAERRVRKEIDQSAPIGPLIWNAVQESLRIIGSALFLALAFASGAQRRGSMKTLLVDFLSIREMFRLDVSGVSRGFASSFQDFKRRNDQRRSLKHHERLRRAHEAKLRQSAKKAERRASK